MCMHGHWLCQTPLLCAPFVPCWITTMGPVRDGPLQRSPSGFNLQPFVCVLVRDAVVKEALSRAMLHSNIGKVVEAPAVVVFASDLGASPCVSVPVPTQRAVVAAAAFLLSLLLHTLPVLCASL